MSQIPFQSQNSEQLASITEYLLTGGTLGEVKEVNQATMTSIYNMAYTQYQNGHYDEAAKGFQYLCFYDHWNAEYFLCLGACQQMMRLFGQAIKTFEYAARMDIKNPLAKVYIGDCFLALKQDNNAIVVYQSALRDAAKYKVEHPELVRIKSLLESWKNEGGNS